MEEERRVVVKAVVESVVLTEDEGGCGGRRWFSKKRAYCHAWRKPVSSSRYFNPNKLSLEKEMEMRIEIEIEGLYMIIPSMYPSSLLHYSQRVMNILHQLIMFPL